MKYLVLSDVHANLEALEATLAKAEAALARNQQLNANSLVSQTDLETAQAAVDSAQAQIDQLDAQIAQSELSVESAELDLARRRHGLTDAPERRQRRLAVREAGEGLQARDAEVGAVEEIEHFEHRLNRTARSDPEAPARPNIDVQLSCRRLAVAADARRFQGRIAAGPIRRKRAPVAVAVQVRSGQRRERSP